MSETNIDDAHSPLEANLARELSALIGPLSTGSDIPNDPYLDWLTDFDRYIPGILARVACNAVNPQSLSAPTEFLAVWTKGPI